MASRESGLSTEAMSASAASRRVEDAEESKKAEITKEEESYSEEADAEDGRSKNESQEEEETTDEIASETTNDDDESRLLAPLPIVNLMQAIQDQGHLNRLADISNPGLVERGQMVPESIKKHSGIKLGRGKLKYV